MTLKKHWADCPAKEDEDAVCICNELELAAVQEASRPKRLSPAELIRAAKAKGLITATHPYVGS